MNGEAMPSASNPLYFNKHLIAALIITPILAIITWLAVDFGVREQPHAAARGDAYQLLAMPNCRYQSGKCSARNGDVRVDLQAASSVEGELLLTLNASLPLDGARLALVEGTAESTAPAPMVADNREHTRWHIRTRSPSSEASMLRLAVAIDGTHYFAELPTRFSDYQTAYDRDFRKPVAPADPADKGQ